MKQARRMLSLLLALMMVFSLSVTAFAYAETDNPYDMRETTQTMNQINVQMANDDPSAELSLYKIVLVEDAYESADAAAAQVQAQTRLRWAFGEGYDLATWVAEFKTENTDIDFDGEMDISDPSNLTNHTQATIDAFYQFIAAKIDNDTEIAAKLQVRTADSKNDSGAATVYSWNGLTQAGYLALAKNGLNVYRPTSVNPVPVKKIGENGEAVWTYPETIVPFTSLMKNTPVSIEKKIIDKADGKTALEDYATVARQDTVGFHITTSIPTYSADYESDEIVYTMVDIYRNAYAYTEDTMKVYGTTTADTTGTELTKDTAYTLYTDVTVYAATTEGEPLFVSDGSTYWTLNGSVVTDIGDAVASSLYRAVVVDFTGKFDQIRAYNGIRYEFDATITDAEAVYVETNTNTANLAYTVNPASPEQVKNVEDEVKSYTYGIGVEKYDGLNNAQKLAGAEFDLYELVGTMEATAVEAWKTANVDKYSDTANFYEETVLGTTQVKVFYKIKNGTTDEQGKWDIPGLDQGEYRIHETKAPEGYNPVNDYLAVTITASAADTKAPAELHSEGMVTLGVANFQGITLPSTGGMGTVLFTMVGVSIMAAAMLLLVLKRRREEGAC